MINCFYQQKGNLNVVHGYSANVVLLVRLIITQIYSEITPLYKETGVFSKN